MVLARFPFNPPTSRPHVIVAAATLKAAEHGVAGDGQADDAPAIQRLVDMAAAQGGGIVELPAGRFHLSTPIRMRDMVSVVGQGPATVVRNLRTEGNTALRACFLFGWFHPYIVHFDEKAGDWDDSTQKTALKDVNRQDTTIRFETAAEAALWQAGDVFWVASPETYDQEVHGILHRLHIRNTLAVVVDVEPGAGKVHLDAPVGWSGRALAVGITPGSSSGTRDVVPWAFVRNASVLNLRCEGHAAVGNTGAVNCSLDVEIDTRQGFWTNAWTGGTVRMTGHFQQRAVEAKYGSSRLDISVSLTRREDGSDDHLVSFGEFAHDCTLHDFEISAPGWQEAFQAIQVQASTGMTIRDGRISAPQSRATLVQLYGDSALRQVGTVFENLSITGGTSSCLNIGDTSHQAPLPPTGAIRNCTFDVQPRGEKGQLAAYIHRAQALELTGNSFAQGYFDIQNGAWNCQILDNRLPGPIIGAGKRNCVIQRNYTHAGKPLT